MIKLVDEHYSHPYSMEQSKHRKDPINKSNLGLKNLKQTEDYIDQVKRRLSLL